MPHPISLYRANKFYLNEDLHPIEPMFQFINTVNSELLPQYWFTKLEYYSAGADLQYDLRKRMPKTDASEALINAFMKRSPIEFHKPRYSIRISIDPTSSQLNPVADVYLIILTEQYTNLIFNSREYGKNAIVLIYITSSKKIELNCGNELVCLLSDNRFSELNYISKYNVYYPIEVLNFDECNINICDPRIFVEIYNKRYSHILKVIYRKGYDDNYYFRKYKSINRFYTEPEHSECPIFDNSTMVLLNGLPKNLSSAVEITHIEHHREILVLSMMLDWLKNVIFLSEHPPIKPIVVYNMLTKAPNDKYKFMFVEIKRYHYRLCQIGI